MWNPFEWVDEKLKEKYRHNETMYRFMKGSITFWLTTLISAVTALIISCQ